MPRSDLFEAADHFDIPNSAVWATRRAVLMEQGLITGPEAGIVVMPRERSVDIDEPFDFITAEAIALWEGARLGAPGVGGCDERARLSAAGVGMMAY